MTAPIAAPAVPGADADSADLGRWIVKLKEWGERLAARLAIVREHYGAE